MTFVRCFLRPTLPLMIFICGGIALHAETDTARAAADTIIGEIISEPIIVDGNRTYTAGSDARFRANDFALAPRGSAQDLLRVVPGLVIAQHAGGGKAEQIFLRGFDADHGTDVNIVVDDAPVNMVSHGHGQGYADLHFIIPEVVERIDVAKGPYFASHGDRATAGSIALTTRDSIDGNLVRIEAGSFGTYRLLTLARPFANGDGGSAYVGASLDLSRGFLQEPQDLRRLILFGKGRARLGDGDVSGSVTGFTSEWRASGQIPERAVRSGEITRLGSIDPYEGGSTSRVGATLAYRTRGRDPLRLTASITDYRFRLFSNFTFFAGDSLRGDGIEQTDERLIVAAKAEKDLSYDLSSMPMRTRVGLDLRSDDIDVGLYHDSARIRLATTDASRIGQRHVAPYAEQTLYLPWGRVVLGLRADYFRFDLESRVDGSPEGGADLFLLSPKANVAMPVGDAVTLFLNSGFGFHSNDARSIIARATPTIPRAFGAELGARYDTPGDLLSLSAAAWTLYLDQEIVFVGDEGTTEESGRTVRRGLDLEARMTPAAWISFGLDATLSRGRYRDLPDGASRIPLAPELTLAADATVRIDRFRGLLQLRHVGDRPANEANTVTAYGHTLVDLSASYRIGPLELFASIQNLFDAEWNETQFDTESRLREEPAAVSELHFTPGMPRGVRGGVGLTF